MCAHSDLDFHPAAGRIRTDCRRTGASAHSIFSGNSCFSCLQKLAKTKKINIFVCLYVIFLKCLHSKGCGPAVFSPSFPSLWNMGDVFVTNLRTYFGTTLLLKFQDDLVNAETERSFNDFFESTPCSLAPACVDLRADSLPITAGTANTLFLWKSSRFLYICTDAFMYIPNWSARLQHEQNWIWNNSWYDRNSKWMLFKMNNTAQCCLNSNGSHRGSSFATILLARKLELLPIPTYLQYA